MVRQILPWVRRAPAGTPREAEQLPPRGSRLRSPRRLRSSSSREDRSRPGTARASRSASAADAARWLQGGGDFGSMAELLSQK